MAESRHNLRRFNQTAFSLPTHDEPRQHPPTTVHPPPQFEGHANPVPLIDATSKSRSLQPAGSEREGEVDPPGFLEPLQVPVPAG